MTGVHCKNTSSTLGEGEGEGGREGGGGGREGVMLCWLHVDLVTHCRKSMIFDNTASVASAISVKFCISEKKNTRK